MGVARIADGCCRQLLGSTKLGWLVQPRVACVEHSLLHEESDLDNVQSVSLGKK